MKQSIIIQNTTTAALDPLVDAFASQAGKEASVLSITSAVELLERLRAGHPCDLVVLDYKLGDGEVDGPEILRELRAAAPLLPVVVVAESVSDELAETVVAEGASDVMERSGALEKRVAALLGKVHVLSAILEENRVLGEQNMLLREADRARHQIIGESPQIREVIQRLERIAVIPRPVLILGERGTGKELVARAIHNMAENSDRPFIAVNCAAFSDALLESELFGHERGAFTGAERQVQGRFEQADGGTLFLDEIGNMSLPFQQKILRVVEYGTFTRVGGREEITTGARIIAATNAELQEKMEAGEFMHDLYDRLAFDVIDVPPLREREGDIDILARHFLDQFMMEIPSLGGKRLAGSALKALRSYRFPGNIRELKNIIERAAYRDTTNEITPIDIGLLPVAETSSAVEGDTFEEKIDNFTRALIEGAYEACGGSQAKAARHLGLTYDKYRYYFRKYCQQEVGV
jgi:DNA-binding NtrC family response regulator